MKHLNNIKTKTLKGKCLMTKKELKEYMNWTKIKKKGKNETNKKQ